jgi:hypothetical protein
MGFVVLRVGGVVRCECADVIRRARASLSLAIFFRVKLELSDGPCYLIQYLALAGYRER